MYDILSLLKVKHFQVLVQCYHNSYLSCNHFNCKTEIHVCYVTKELIEYCYTEFTRQQNKKSSTECLQLSYNESLYGTSTFHCLWKIRESVVIYQHDQLHVAAM